MDINISPYEEDTSLYSVERAVIEANKGDYTCFLILRDRLPATDLNKHLILKQKKSAHPCSTGAYVIASLLNEMYDRGLEIEDITRGHIFDYLTEAYVEEGKAYKTILSYITIIGDLFDDLHVHGIPIHSSLLMTDKNALYVLKNKKERRCITTIPLMRKDFLPNKNAVISNSMFSYTKWYTKDQIDALAKELSKLPGIEVCYLKLKDHPYHDKVDELLSGYGGGILNFRAGSKERAFKIINSLEYALIASNIGDLRTLVIHPYSTLYINESEEEKNKAGVFEDTVRVSVGIEDARDLIRDFTNAVENST